MSQSKQLALSIADLLEALPARGRGPTTNVRVAWSEELRVPDGSPELFLALSVQYGRLKDLRHRVQASTQSERAKDLYIGAIDALDPFVSPAQVSNQSTQNLSNSKDKINLLHLLADAFPDELVPEVQPATLEALCKELDGILRSLAEAEVDEDLRSFIRSSIDALLMVMRNYRHFGPDGAARIYGSVAAELARKARQEPPQTKEEKSFLKKALDVTKKMGAVVIWTAAVTGAADKMLTDGSDIVQMVTGDESAASDEEVSQ